MRCTTILVESARAKTLREGVVEHDIRRDVPGEIRAAANAGLGVGKIVMVQVVAVVRRAKGGRRVGVGIVRHVAAIGSTGDETTVQAALEAAETSERASLHGVFEAEPARARGDRQGLGN